MSLSPPQAPPWFLAQSSPIPINGAGNSPPKLYGSFVDLDYFKHVKLTPEPQPARNSMGLSFGLDVTSLLETHSQEFLFSLA